MRKNTCSGKKKCQPTPRPNCGWQCVPQRGVSLAGKASGPQGHSGLQRESGQVSRRTPQALSYPCSWKCFSGFPLYSEVQLLTTASIHLRFQCSQQHLCQFTYSPHTASSHSPFTDEETETIQLINGRGRIWIQLCDLQNSIYYLPPEAEIFFFLFYARHCFFCLFLILLFFLLPSLHPSPLATINLLSISMGLFLFCFVV